MIMRTSLHRVAAMAAVVAVGLGVSPMSASAANVAYWDGRTSSGQIKRSSTRPHLVKGGWAFTGAGLTKVTIQTWGQDISENRSSTGWGWSSHMTHSGIYGISRCWWYNPYGSGGDTDLYCEYVK